MQIRMEQPFNVRQGKQHPGLCMAIERPKGRGKDHVCYFGFLHNGRVEKGSLKTNDWGFSDAKIVVQTPTITEKITERQKGTLFATSGDVSTEDAKHNSTQSEGPQRFGGPYRPSGRLQQTIDQRYSFEQSSQSSDTGHTQQGVEKEVAARHNGILTIMQIWCGAWADVVPVVVCGRGVTR